MSRLLVAIDGGGSRTRAVVADHSGQILGSADGGPSAVRPGDIEHSAGTVASVTAAALAAAGASTTRPVVLYVGVAGVGRASEQEGLQRALTARGLADDVIVQPDALVALEDAFGDGPGILLIAGTGSVAYGRGPTGAVARCGGWGPVCGDEGSGAWLGRRALSVVTAATDGREPETALTGAVVTAAEVRGVEDLIAWAARATPADLASLAPAVLQCAASDDPRASAVVSFAAEELVLHVLALARRLFGDERAGVPVAFAGGLLSRGSPLRARVEHRLKSAVPGAQLETREVDAVRGAVRAALRTLRAAEHTVGLAAAP